MASLPVRAHQLVLGTVLFLSSELMFFAALFASYFALRANAAIWPPPGVKLDVAASTVGTFLLFAASVVMVLAGEAVKRGKLNAARRWTASAVAAAAGFVLLALYGYARENFTMASNAYGSLYYTLTGFHLLHVIVGVGLLLAIFFGLRSPALLADRHAGFESMTYYWHFVFVVWLGIWATLYLLR